MLNYDEAPYPQVHAEGLKRSFVARESTRAVRAVEGLRTRMLAGLDVDIPVLRADLGPSRAKKSAAVSTRRDMAANVLQALDAGVHGLVVSREYTEMRLESLQGVGDALRQAGWKR